MYVRYFLLLLLIPLAHFCSAQSAGNTRPPFTLKILVSESYTYQTHVPETPYIYQKDVVTIFPGEKLFVEADVLNGKLVNMHIVPQLKNKDKTVVIELYQERPDNTRNHMIMSVYNPFAKFLFYDAQFTRINEQSANNSLVTPVRPGKVAYETWPDMIKTMSLYNFSLQVSK